MSIIHIQIVNPVTAILTTQWMNLMFVVEKMVNVHVIVRTKLLELSVMRVNRDIYCQMVSIIAKLVTNILIYAMESME